MAAETAHPSTTPATDRRPSKPRTVVAAPANRELPNNLELERAILAVLLDGRHALAMSTVRQVIEHPMAFFHRDHRIIYLACLELDDGTHRVDAQSVAELLSRYDFKAVLERLRQQQLLLDSDQLDTLGRDRLRTFYRRAPEDDAALFEDSALAAIGGFNALTDLGDAFAPAAGLERNVALLWDYHLKRRMIQRLQALCDKAYRTPETFSALLDEGSQSILDLGRFNQMASVHSLSTVVDETLDDIQSLRDNPELGLTTGIADVDKRLVSLRPGGFYVLAARPGVGKTSLALKIVSNITGHAEHPQPALFFSLEVDRKDLVKKLLSAEAGVSFRVLEPGGVYQQDDEANLAKAAGEFKHWKLDLMDVSDLTVQALRSVVKRRMLETKGQLKLVVLDYLQLLNSVRQDASEYEKISEISRVLKVLARELRIPVMALSQMSRESERGATQPREPRLSDLRGSGSIEQDADAVIFMHRTDTGEDLPDHAARKIKIIIAKNRFGPTGVTYLNFFPEKMRFEMCASEDRLDDGGAYEPDRFTSRRERLEKQPQPEEDVLKRDG